MFERMYSTRKLNSSLGLALALFCLCAVSCANMFQDKVAMSRSGSSATLGSLLVGKSEITKLDKPSYVNVSLYEFNNKIRITWDSVKNATSYSLERAVVKEKTNGKWKSEGVELDYEPLEHSSYITGTSYTDTIITGSADNLLDCENENYRYAFFYRVKAVNTTLGVESPFTESDDEGRLLAPPSGTTATMGESETTITVTWDKTDGAVRYEIYRSQNEDGSNAVSLGTTLATQYVDTPPTVYAGEDLYYIVRSVGGYSGEKSIDGSVALGYTLVKGAPKAVGKVEVVQGEGHGDKTGSIKIRFDDTQTDVGYTVYRTSSESATMKKLVEIKAGDSKEHLDTKDLKENIYYYYYVQTSKKETEGEGENAKETVLKGPMSKSGPNDTSPAEGFILSKPSSVEVVKNRDKSDYTISFAPVIGDAKFATKGAKASYSNNYEYVVLGDGSQNGSFGGEAGRNYSSSLTYNEATGKYSMDILQDKFYKMKVVYNGAETGLTSVVAPSPYEAQNVYVTCAALVLDNGEDSSQYKPVTDKSTTDTEKANANGVHKVKITWTAPDDGADYYEVYRSEKIGSGFKKISGDNPLPSSQLEYVDDNESAKVGQIYYYKVLSLNELKQGANYSEIDAPVLEGGIIKTTERDGVRYGRGWGWGALTAWQYVHEMCKTVDRSHAKSKKLTTSSLTGKIGTEIINGDVTGVLDYNAQMDGIGGRAILQYKDYVDYYIGGDKTLGYYFMLNGYTNSTANASQNGTMDGTVTCQGMYRGSVKYDAIEVKGGDSGGGYYILRRTGIDDADVNVSFLAGKK